MFDPTIFDNLKVVLEGKLYDWDFAGVLEIIGREDRVDLAAFARTFRMRLRRPDEDGETELTLSSGLTDFAGELGGLRLASEPPGAMLQVAFTLPGEKAARFNVYHERLSADWGETAHISHERIVPLLPGPTDAADTWSSDGIYRIRMTFRSKINEAHIDDIDDLLEQLLATMEYLDA